MTIIRAFMFAIAAGLSMKATLYLLDMRSEYALLMALISAVLMLLFGVALYYAGVHDGIQEERYREHAHKPEMPQGNT